MKNFGKSTGLCFLALISFGSDSFGFASKPMSPAPATAPVAHIPFSIPAAVGDEHICVISASQVKCWGNNDHGQSVPPTNLKNPIQVAVALGVSCALGDDGVTCWGDLTNNSVPTNFHNPWQLVGDNGGFCALDEDGLKCWGAHMSDSSKWINPPALHNPVQVALSSDAICAVDDDGLKCWATDSLGDLTKYFVPPATLALSWPGVKPSLLIGHAHDLCAVYDDKRLECWGSTIFGYSAFVQIAENTGYVEDSNLKKIIQASVGTWGACVITDDDEVSCWNGSDHQWNGWAGKVPVPFQLKSPYFIAGGMGAVYDSPQDGKLDVTFGSSGSSSHGTVCLLDGDGPHCWGENNYFISAATSRPINNPHTLSSGLAKCVIDDDGLKCWGSNFFGELSPPENLKNPREVSVGMHDACAIDDDGVKCWGLNESGQETVPNVLKNPHNILVNDREACVTDDDGLKCWGKVHQSVPSNPLDLLMGSKVTDSATTSERASGICGVVAGQIKCQCEDPLYVTTDDPDYICQISPVTNATKVALGEAYGCAIDAGQIKCWGFTGAYGQTTVPTNCNFKNPRQIAVGDNYNCVLDDDGVKCWSGSLDAYLGTTYTDVSGCISYDLKNPRAISGTGPIRCFLDDTGLHCYSSTSYQDGTVLSVALPTAGDQNIYRQ